MSAFHGKSLKVLKKGINSQIQSSFVFVRANCSPFVEWLRVSAIYLFMAGSTVSWSVYFMVKLTWGRLIMPAIEPRSSKLADWTLVWPYSTQSYGISNTNFWLGAVSESIYIQIKRDSSERHIKMFKLWGMWDSSGRESSCKSSSRRMG